MNKQIIIQKLQQVMDLHKKMSKSYFYNPPTHASARRLYEKENSLETEVEVDGVTYRFVQTTNCSCRYVYYDIKYYIDGV